MWGDKLFILSAVLGWRRRYCELHAARRRRRARRAVVMAIDRRTGKTIGNGPRMRRCRRSSILTTARGRRPRDDRRRARHRLVRLVRLLRLRHERDAGLAEGPRRQADAQQFGEARRRPATTRGVWDHSRGASFITALDKTGQSCGASSATRSTPQRRSLSSTMAPRRSSTA